MTALAWTDELRLNQPQMDKTHEEFVTLLAQARTALEAGDREAGLAAFETLLEHTVEHFGQEDGWMQATGFAPENCHTRQHDLILQLMREVIRLARSEGRWEPIGILADELGTWFPQHATMMDAGLALQMAEVGFDPATGDRAVALPDAAIGHCGSAGCR